MCVCEGGEVDGAGSQEQAMCEGSGTRGFQELDALLGSAGLNRSSEAFGVFFLHQIC